MAKTGWKGGIGSPSQRAEISDWRRALLGDLTQAASPRQDMDTGARIQLAELVSDCEGMLFGELAAIRADDWYVEALAALCGAGERLRWAAWCPNMMGDWPALVAAARLLGRAQHAIAIGRSRRRKPGRPFCAVDTKASFIAAELRAQPTASSAEIARKLNAHQVDPVHVRKVRKRLTRQK